MACVLQHYPTNRDSVAFDLTVTDKTGTQQHEGDQERRWRHFQRAIQNLKR
jgi:hypothetical protein